MILDVEGIFLFICKDAHLREISFLLNKMIVLCLIEPEPLCVLSVVFIPILENTVKLGILWANFKLAIQRQVSTSIFLIIMVSLP